MSEVTAVCRYCDLPIHETRMGRIRNEWEHVNGLSFCADGNHWAWPKEPEVTPPSPQPATKYFDEELRDAALACNCRKTTHKGKERLCSTCEGAWQQAWDLAEGKITRRPAPMEAVASPQDFSLPSMRQVELQIDLGPEPKPAPQTEQTFRSDEVLLREILSYNRRRYGNHPKFDIAIREACIKLQGFDPDEIHAAKGTR